MELSTKLFRKRSYRWGVVCFLMCFLFFSTSVSIVTAGPEGAQVVNGQVTIQQSGSNTAITASDKAIINYSSFDIAQPETVQFIQPGSTASVLNRILSANPTNINGTLLANGRVFFVNPAGVYIGNGARINVNQLVASGLNISNADFINGSYNFAGGNGAVINDGDISAQQVYLIGKQVINSGNISCPAGYVVMAAGDRVFLGEPGSDIVLDVEGTSLSESANAAATEVGVLNEGTIDAAGGIIALAAAGDIYSQAISNVGTLSTSVDAGDAGQIKLAAAGGEVVNKGTIEASGSEGGQVSMEGARVGQFGTIHADGTYGDGGNVDLTASDVVALSSDSLTTANAGLNGDGGDVIVYSPDTALFRTGAQIEAKGGSESGNGGFVEVSGKEHVEVFGSVDTTAPKGATGMFLIDPYNITISSSATSGGDWTPPGNPDTFTSTSDSSTLLIGDLKSNLESNNISVVTGDGGVVQAGDITVADPIDYTDIGLITYNNLTLEAHNDIIVNAEITAGTHDLTLIADSDSLDGGNVSVNAAINLTSGNFTSSGVNFASNSSGAITTTGGNVDLSGHTGAVDIDAAINSGGSVDVAGSSININSNIAGVGISFGNAVIADGAGLQTFDAGTGTLTAPSTISKASGNLVLGGDTDIDLNGAVTVSAGSLTVGDSAHIADDITAVGVTFTGAVTADGASLQTFEAGTGTLTSTGISKATGALTLGGDTAINVSGGLSAVGLTLDDDVTATSAGSQTFEAGTGTLTSAGISKAAGALTLGGDTDIDLNGAVTVSAGSLTVDDPAHIADDVTAVGVTFTGAVTADGAGLQTFDAGTGTLSAGGTISKASGNLVLGGDTDINLNGAVTVSAGSLTVAGSSHIADDVTAVGANFTGAVTADGAGLQTFDAGTGTLTAPSTISKASGNLVLGGDTDIDLNGAVTISAGSLTVDGPSHIADNVTTSGNQTYNDDVTVANGKILSAGNNLTVGTSITGGGVLTLIATGGSISGSGTIQANDGVGTQGDLTLRQGDSLNLANLTFGNQSTTDLTAQSYNDGITIDNTKPANAADKWQSIMATAENNIELQGTDDIKLGGDLTSSSGGVSIISDSGTVRTAGDTILDNVTITGNPAAGAGVDLPFGSGKAAIMIRTEDDLILGSDAELIANGIYDPQQYDDRSGVGFEDSISGGGDPIDVAIYLRSNRLDASLDQVGNVTVGSEVTIGDNGTMVIDAGEKVIFGGKFNESVFNQTHRLEVVSRRSDNLNEVVRYDRLPFADNPEVIRNWFNETSTGYFAGAYVLRGVKTLLAEVLALTNPVPLVPPRTLEPEFRSEVEGPDTEALANLLSELGIGVQPYVTEAYADSLSTDLRLYKAAEKLQELMPILEDANGIHIAGLREAVAQYFPTLDVLSEEGMDSFTQVLTSHKGDGTDYDLAGQCIFALIDYVNILGTDIGWPVETSVEFVMGRYVPRITENDEIRIAVIQMHLQR